MRFGKTKILFLAFFLVCSAVGGRLPAAEPDLNDELVQMIVDLVSEADRDMRALGLQQVREEVQGEAATQRFAELLPKLPPDGQAGLIEALGERGDIAARPAVLAMLDSQDETVRAAAVGALGALGDVSQVPLLAEKTASGSDTEKTAAEQSLVRLRGEDVNSAIVSTLDTAVPEVRAQLLRVLAARNAKEALPSVLENATAAEGPVRLAALGAIRYLADENNTADVVGVLKGAQDDAERRQAKLALLTVCSRGREACVEAIIAGLQDADSATRVALLHALARAGGGNALETVVAHLKDDDEKVRDEALRMLSRWIDRAATVHLMQVAKTSDSLRDQVLAIRGLVRLASPQEDKAADLDTLAEALSMATRPEEKRLVLGALGAVPTQGSLKLVMTNLDDPAVGAEAGLAAVMIGEKIEDGDGETIATAMKKVLKGAKSQQVRERAKKVLASQGS